MNTKIFMFVWGAFGGLLPTLSTKASTYVTNPDTALPAIGLYFGLALWAVVGGGVALLNNTSEQRQAIFAGIAAPAILTSLISGASHAPPSQNASITTKATAIFDVLWVGSAHAQDTVDHASTGSTNLLVVTPKVDGGLPAGVELPVQVKIKGTNNQTFLTKIGTISTLQTSSIFTLPSGTQDVTIFGKTVPVNNKSASIKLNIVTSPTAGGDFLWALGAKRQYDINSISISPK